MLTVGSYAMVVTPASRALQHPQLWAPPREDVPTRGRPMSTRVEDAALPHRRILKDLGALPVSGLRTLTEPLIGPSPNKRAVRLVAGVIAIRAALTGRDVDARAAIEWFIGDQLGRPSSSDDPVRTVRWAASHHDSLVSLLPHVLDPFGPTTRRDLLAGRACADERGSRKRLGTFYTPGDVARLLAREVVTEHSQHVLDPACGSGVFLRAAFTELSARIPASTAVACLYGVDVDQAAIDACALVLTHDWIARQTLSPTEPPAARFAEVRSRLVCADALELFSASPRSQLFDEVRRSAQYGLPSGFDAILMNPPYAPVGPGALRITTDYASLHAAANPSGVNMAWPFWELASRLTARDGRAGIVLPLSAACIDSRIARSARASVFSRGHWEMRFFDRTPDALFGDDVKQRVALAFRRPGSRGTISTTSLRRWSADGRAAALSIEGGHHVEVPVDPGPVMKIGSSLEREAVERLRSLHGTIGDGAERARFVRPADLDGDGRSVAVAPTAYNWMGAYREVEVAAEARRCASGKVAEIVFSTSDGADAAYGLIVSRVFLWWWRVTGDMFHVPLSDLGSAPFPLHRCSPHVSQRLAIAGRRCWNAALGNPIVAVNRGVRTVSYRPPPRDAALDAADLAVGIAFGLSREFVRFVRQDADRLRTAGRGP